MCGIVGYIGYRSVVPILIQGLKRLEYRGYDSAGIAVLDERQQLHVIKRAGKVNDLAITVESLPIPSTIGIGHTRWATHGAPNDINAHPHTDQDRRLALVHNGIIENYQAIRTQLLREGYQLKTETDTEVLTVFIRSFYDKVGDLREAVRLALAEVEGTFGIAIVSPLEPNLLIAARRGSPLLIGLGNDENFVASDAAAVIQYTRDVIFLQDNEISFIQQGEYEIRTIDNQPSAPEIFKIEYDLEQIEKGGYEHFMLKEIFEQPTTFRDACRGRILLEEGNVRLGGLRPVADTLQRAQRLILTACGTSWHAALVGEYLIEDLARIPVEVEYASEFRYRNPVLSKDDIVIAISQSGETADTLAAIREAKLRGATTLGIVNVVGSTIARETDAGVYIHAGPEIGVASTKAFTSQLAVLSLLAIYLGRMRHLSPEDGRTLLRELQAIPEKIQRILEQADLIQHVALQYKDAANFLYLGRSYNFPVALEGALKLKEISYIHAEGYPAAEMKHGPIALIDENMPVVFIAPQDELYEKILSNIEEVRARGGKIISIATEGDRKIADVSDHTIYIPRTLPYFTPVLSVIPLQLLAYYIAVERGCNVDMPRNLAKSVTVE